MKVSWWDIVGELPKDNSKQKTTNIQYLLDYERTSCQKKKPKTKDTKANNIQCESNKWTP